MNGIPILRKLKTEGSRKRTHEDNRYVPWRRSFWHIRIRAEFQCLSFSSTSIKTTGKFPLTREYLFEICIKKNEQDMELIKTITSWKRVWLLFFLKGCTFFFVRWFNSFRKILVSYYKNHLSHLKHNVKKRLNIACWVLHAGFWGSLKCLNYHTSFQQLILRRNGANPPLKCIRQFQTGILKFCRKAGLECVSKTQRWWMAFENW